MTSALPLDDQKIQFASGSGSGSTFGANHYSMGVDIADGGWSGSNYSDLIIGYHTGIRIGAGYSGIRFYDNSPTTDTNNTGNGNGGEELLMTVGGGGSTTSGAHVTVHNNLTVQDDIYVGDQIIHDGDTDTYMQFHAADQWRVVTAGAERLEVNNTDTTLATNLQINSHAINMDMNNVADNAIEIREVRDSTWPLQFVSNDVGNDNHSGFWVGSNGYPDMRLRREDATVRALISSWETSFVSNGLNVTGNLQAFDDIIIGNYSSTDTGSLVLTGSTANKQAVLKCTNGNLHMDSDSGNNMYLNYYSGNGIAFGNGGTGIVAWMGSDGDLWKGSADNTGSKYWHAGNDGSGSGLDADLLDGYQLSTTRNAANTVPVRDASGYLQLGWINTTSGSTTNTITKIYGTYNNDNYIRYFTPATLISQQGIWTSGNDGASSGLDADLLDGQHGSYYYPASNPNGYTTYTANQPLNTNSNATFNALYVAGEIIHSGDTNTYISFHAEDHWRVVTGGAERLEVNNAQITSTEPIHAPSFHGDGSSLTGIAAGATGGGNDDIFYENGQNVTSNYTITNGKNAMSAGPITINSGVTVTVGAGETWTVV